MVRFCSARSVIISTWLGLILLAGTARSQVQPAAAVEPSRELRPVASDPVGQAKSALKDGSFPWYDPKTDAVRPIDLPDTRESKPPSSTSGNSRWEWSDYLVFGGFSLALAILVTLVIRYWERFEPKAGSVEDAVLRSASTSVVGEVLPAGLRAQAATDDPWSEASRRRQAGDFAGAILCIFAHQLLSMSRLGLVRLAPGRTGRQLHRSVADRDFQALMFPTLRQFEAVYYGHRVPSEADFAAVWTSAEAFERRAAEQVAR